MENSNHRKDFWKAIIYTFGIVRKISCSFGIICTLISLFTNFLPLVTAFLWKIIMDKLQLSYEMEKMESHLWVYLILFVTLQAAGRILNSVYWMVSRILGNKIQYALNLQMMGVMVNLDCAFYDDPKNKDILDKVNQWKGYICRSVQDSIGLVMNLLFFAAAFAMFLPYNPLLGIIYIVTFLPGSAAQYRARKNLDIYSIDSIPETRKKNYYRSILTEPDYAKELRLYNYAGYIKSEFQELWKHIRKERSKIFREGVWKVLGSSLFSLAGFLLLFSYSISSVAAGVLSLGTLAMYISLLEQIGSNFNTIAFRLPFYRNFLAARILAYQSFLESVPPEQEEEKETVPRMPDIEFKNVCFRYPGNSMDTLNNLSFKIRSGEKIALLGKNGAGKSTIVKLLLRFYEPQKGQILLNGRDIRHYSIASVCRLFGVYFQDVQKYALSFGENIAISDISRVGEKERIAAAAAYSGANQIYENLPGGLDANLTRDFDDNGYDPSIGQWQKIAISRAFFRDADWVILDEPSSALDPEAEDFFFRQFQKLQAEKGGILISHRLSSVTMANKIILIDQGSLLEYGTHEELMAQGGEYSRYFRLQADYYEMKLEAVREMEGGEQA